MTVFLPKQKNMAIYFNNYLSILNVSGMKTSLVTYVKYANATVQVRFFFHNKK